MYEVKQATKSGWIPLIEGGGVADLSYPGSTTRRGRVQHNGMVCPTILTESEVCVIGKKILDAAKKVVDVFKNKFAIRRLTPRECWRLMSFGHKNEDGTWDDTEFEKAQSVCSDTQLYKQAGNSICECVLRAIFMEMMPE